MSLKYLLLLVSLTFSCVARSGCLEPEKSIFDGQFAVESCSYFTTTNVQYDDPRLSEVKINRDSSNPTAMLGKAQQKANPKVLMLSAKDKGVVISGITVDKSEKVSAFYRTLDKNFCEKFIKSNLVKLSISELCCDCNNSCSNTPCAVGTKNEIKKLQLK